MKKAEEIEVPERYFERNPLILLGSVLISTALIGAAFYLFFYKDFYQHGWALVLTPPALISGFQTLIFILNPYALIYKDKMELKKNMFNNKVWYFNDIERVSEVSNTSFKITYNDGEEETLYCRGIRPSQLKELRDELHKQVYLSLERRDLMN